MTGKAHVLYWLSANQTVLCGSHCKGSGCSSLQKRAALDCCTADVGVGDIELQLTLRQTFH